MPVYRKPLHVAINARFLLPGRLEGLGRYAHEVTSRLVAQHPEARFSLLFDRAFHPRYIYGPNAAGHVLFPQARHPLLYLWYFEFSLPQVLAELEADVFFSPDGYLSLRANLPQVPVFHDLAFEIFPHDIDAPHRWHYRAYFPRFARKAAHILTVSEFTKQDIIRAYDISPGKITVAHNGASGAFAPTTPAEQAAARNRWAHGAQYFLYVGAIQPRKNIARLLAAYGRFQAETGHPARLVLTGRKAWQYADVEAEYAALPHPERVVFTGHVPDADLALLYGGALALAYVSRFEGFGLPILEALHAEVPVLCGNTSSMPEVAGPAALLVDPYSVSEIADGMRRLAYDPALRARLAAAGRAQRKLFNWDDTATRVWEVLAAV